jgi:methionyl-tRNA formyltransferase
VEASGESGGHAGRTRALFFGSGAFAVSILAALVDAPETELVGVVTAPARPAGRRGELAPTPVATAAATLGVPILTPARLRDAAALAELAALRPGIGILADYGKILPPAVLDLPPHGILNLHPSLLPRHRGATPIPAAILAGDEGTGVSLFRMDPGMDTGPIVAVERVALAGTEDAPGLEDALAAVAARLLRRSLAGWLAGELPAVPQPEVGVSVTRPLRREDGRLEPARPAAELERAVRAFRPWPGTYVELGGERVAVLAASRAPAQRADQPGLVVLEGARPALATVEGRLVLDAVRPAGGREMDGPAFLRGHPGVLRAPGGIIRTQ